MKSNEQGNGTPRRKLALGVLRDNLGYLSRLTRNVAVQTKGEFLDDMGFATGLRLAERPGARAADAQVADHGADP
jgi:hypothetical protein